VLVGGMVRGEGVWVVCVCISFTGDGGQLGSTLVTLHTHALRSVTQRNNIQ